MKRFSIILIIFISPLLLLAQKKPNKAKMGKITQAEWDLNEVPFEKDAPAVVLFDKAFTEFKYNGGNGDLEYYVKRHVRIKVLNKEGYDKANVSIPYFVSAGGVKESITGLKGMTHNIENGEKISVKLKKDDIFTEEGGGGWKYRKFALPKVKEGSIIEYEYRFSSDYISKLDNWYFQTDIPTLYSEWRFGEGSPLEFGTRFVKPEYVKSGAVKNMVYAENLPSINEEPFGPYLKDHTCQITFNLRGYYSSSGKFNPLDMTYKTFNENQLKNPLMTQHLEKDNKALEPIIENHMGGSTDLEKVQSLFEYVRTNVTWNEVMDAYPDRKIEKVLKEKNGTSAEINMLLSALLRQAGFKAYPILCSTRDNGTPNQIVPKTWAFNSMICQVIVGDKEYLIDASSPVLPFGLLRSDNRNGKGWKLDALAKGWVDLKENAVEKRISQVKMKWEDGQFKGNIKAKHTAYGAVGLLVKKYSQKDSDSNDFLLESINESWNASSPTLKVDDKTLNCSSTLQISHTPEEEEMIYLDANVIPLFEENPFTEESRTLPVDLPYGMDERIVTFIDIPEGYAVESMPESKNFILQGKAGKLIYSVKEFNGQVQINLSFKINQLNFTVEEYPALREFIQLAIETTEQVVVFKKNQ